MTDEIIIFRMVRYFTILTREHYDLEDRFNKAFNLPRREAMTLQQIMENVCKDFGLNYEIVLEHSKLEDWNTSL